jgi:predicted glutamine amidotransferase
MWIVSHGESEDYLRRRHDPFLGSTWIFLFNGSTAGYELPDYYRLRSSQDDLKSYDSGFSNREIPMLLAGEKNPIVPLTDSLCRLER